MLVLGDAHAHTRERRRALYAAYRAAAADVALQAGDLFYYRPPVRTHFIAGNNENFDVIEALRTGTDPPLEVRNLHLLDGSITEVHGRRVAGLSGNFAPTVFGKPRSALVGDRRRHFVRDDIDRLVKLEDVEILLVHEAPQGLPVEEDYRVGCRHINRAIREVQPELCLVGHHHQDATATVEGCRTVALAPVWERYYLLDPETLELEAHETPSA